MQNRKTLHYRTDFRAIKGEEKPKAWNPTSLPDIVIIFETLTERSGE